MSGIVSGLAIHLGATAIEQSPRIAECSWHRTLAATGHHKGTIMNSKNICP